MRESIEGTPVSEEEAAKGLGFGNVEEFRRWQTETGRELAETKFALKKAKDEAQGFWWHLRRSQVVLAKAKELLQNKIEDKELAEKVLFAIDVIESKAVDWDKKLDDWLEPVNEELRKRPSIWGES